MLRSLRLLAAAVIVLAPCAFAQSPYDCAPYPWLDVIQQPLADPLPPEYRPGGAEGEAPITRRPELTARVHSVANQVRRAPADESGAWRRRLAAHALVDRADTYCPTNTAFTFWYDGEWAEDMFTLTAIYNESSWPVKIRREFEFYGKTEWYESRFTYQDELMASYEEEYYYGVRWREDYSYDGQGRITEVQGAQYFDGEWYPAHRVMLTYGGGQWAEGFAYDVWVGSGWQSDFRGTYTYESGRLTQAHYEAWTGSGWETDDLETYEYDEAGRVVKAEWVFWQQRILIDYNAEGRMLTWTEQSGYDGWETYMMIEYAYGSSGLPSELVIHYAFYKDGLGPYARLRYGYEGGLFQSVETDYYYSDSWELSYRETLARDAQSRPTERLGQTYWDGVWHNNARVTYGYDAPTSTEATPFAVVLGLQVAPNPAHGSTALLFDLATPADVRIALFDVLGRRVQQVYEGELPSGSQRTALDISSLSSGVYVVRVETSGQVITRRMTVVR